MTRHWWFNELGMLVHLRCGRVGCYAVHEGRHYLACLTCKARLPAPAPSLPHWHARYGQAS